MSEVLCQWCGARTADAQRVERLEVLAATLKRSVEVEAQLPDGVVTPEAEAAAEALNDAMAALWATAPA